MRHQLNEIYLTGHGTISQQKDKFCLQIIALLRLVVALANNAAIRKLMLSLALAGAVALGIPEITEGQTATYTAIDLHISSNDAPCINNNGQVAGSSSTTGHAFLYTAGSTIDLGTLGGVSSVGTAINNHGQVAGISLTSNGYEHAFLYSGGAMSDLGTLGASYSFAYGLNDSGVVVGDSASATGEEVPFLYNGTMQALGSLLGGASNAKGVNAGGQVVGWSSSLDGPTTHAFLYNGALHDLGTLGGTAAYATIAAAINNKGQIVGQSGVASNTIHAFLYTNGSMADLGTLGGSFSAAIAVNNTGQIVGYSLIPTGYSHAFIYQNGVMNDLNNLVSIPGGSYLRTATGINDSGQIVAQAANNEIYLLTPKTGEITALDPVPDLLKGSQITTAATAAQGQPYLADLTKGRSVTGIAADGAAQVVLRIPATSVGQAFTIVVDQTQCASLSASECIDEYGLIFDPTTPPLNIFSNSGGGLPITVTAVSTANGPIAFAAYRSPVDFTRSEVPSDATSTQRSIAININNGLQPDFSLVLVRPPVVFIHGFNSDAQAAWISFPTNAAFTLKAVDYGYSIDPTIIGDITPAPPLFAPFEVKHSQLGVMANYLTVFSQTQAVLSQYSTGANIPNLQVAVVKADIVAHSMGGLIARYIAHQGGYISRANFSQGLFHKLITLGTPYYGTPQAILQLQNENSCVLTLGDYGGSYSITSANFNGSVVSGAVNDLQGRGDGLSLSPLLNLINSPTPVALPTAIIAGDIGTQITAIQENIKTKLWWARYFCGPTTVVSGTSATTIRGQIESEVYSSATGTTIIGTDLGLNYIVNGMVNASFVNINSPLAARYKETTFETQFDPVVVSPTQPNGSMTATPSDASVPVTSAKGGFNNTMVFDNHVHSEGWVTLGFPGPHLQNSVPVGTYVYQLLNTSIRDPLFNQ